LNSNKMQLFAAFLERFVISDGDGLAL
jgi:hypothetical protein